MSEYNYDDCFAYFLAFIIKAFYNTSGTSRFIGEITTVVDAITHLRLTVTVQLIPAGQPPMPLTVQGKTSKQTIEQWSNCNLFWGVKRGPH